MIYNPLNIKEPWRRFRRFPFVHQLEAADCGSACLEMITRFYGRDYSRQLLRQLCQVDRLGLSMASISHAAEQLGFKTLGLKVAFDDLRELFKAPCIVHWLRSHFVVVYRIKGDRVYVADPASGLITYRRAEFEQGWLAADSAHGGGFVLSLEPTEMLRPSESDAQHVRTPFMWRPFWNDARGQIAPIAVGAAVSLGIQFVLPFLAVTLVDRGILGRNLGLIQLILLAQLVLMLGRLAIESIQGLVVSRIGLRIDIRLVSTFLMKLTRLPLSFFSIRNSGELLQRISDHQAIQQFLTETIATVLLSVLSLGIFGAVLIVFSPWLFVVFVIGSISYLLYCRIFVKYERLLNYKNFQLSVRNFGLIVEFLSAMQELKLNNAAERRRWRWERTQQAILRTQLRSQFLSRLQIGGGTAINEMKNLLITLIVARSVVAGRMSLGTMVAIQAIIGQLTWPLNQLALLISKGHDAALSNERAQDIHRLENEEDSTERGVVCGNSDIVLRDVSFSYGGTRTQRVLRNISLRIPHGKTTAIVGRSGTGKTTLLRLLLKFYEPNTGVVMVGPHDIGTISHYEWRQLCGVVLQDGYIFSDSILGNIVLSQENADLDRVAYVCQISQISSFIDSLPLGYETRIGQQGIGISRGQAQRILIARALYKDPRYLFFDEATSSLDTETERAILTGLQQSMKGRTLVVIAHRLSTVKDADQVIVMDGGAVVEVGMHEELVIERGAYYDLVRDQLDLAE